MRGLLFFPIPYPDECYYSIFCRYFARSGSTSNKRTIFELFGEAQSIATFVYLPRRLELLENWVRNGSLITRESLARQNSCYAYFSTAFPDQMFQGMARKIKTGEANRGLERQIVQKCRRTHWPEFLRYCPECVKEDFEKYGETYWHRLPQLPGIEYCPKHGQKIQDSTVCLRETSMRFFPASYVLRKMQYQESVETLRYKHKYMNIAKDTEWLMENGLKFGGCREIARKYKEVFMEKGLTTAQGVRYRDRIEKEFIQYHGQEFLKQLFSGDEKPLYWLEFAFVSVSQNLRPLHHILLMEFLKGTVEKFYEAVPEIEPYGHGPWPCVNKICSHYGKDGAKKLSISYLNGQTIGQFQCESCGMKYQRSRPEKPFEEYVKHVTILDYGHYWYETLKECVEIKKMCLKETVAALRCTSTTVKKRADEIGLNLSQNRESCIYEEKEGCRIDRSRYFRKKVTELLERQPELTAKELKEQVPGAYSWFRKNDPQWLKQRLVTEQEKIHWKVWEQEQLNLLRNAYETIKKTGDPDRRVTVGWLCTVAGLRECDIKGRLHRFPDLRAFINATIEGKEEGLTRRFMKIAENKKQSSENLTIVDIRREMSLKPNTYRRYADFIENLIRKLNKGIHKS